MSAVLVNEPVCHYVMNLMQREPPITWNLIVPFGPLVARQVWVRFPDRSNRKLCRPRLTTATTFLRSYIALALGREDNTLVTRFGVVPRK